MSSVVSQDMLFRLEQSLDSLIRQVKENKGTKGAITLSIGVEREDDTDVVVAEFKIKQTIGDSDARSAVRMFNGRFEVPERQLSLSILNEMSGPDGRERAE